MERTIGLRSPRHRRIPGARLSGEDRAPAPRLLRLFRALSTYPHPARLPPADPARDSSAAWASSTPRSRAPADTGRAGSSVRTRGVRRGRRAVLAAACGLLREARRHVSAPARIGTGSGGPPATRSAAAPVPRSGAPCQPRSCGRLRSRWIQSADVRGRISFRSHGIFGIFRGRVYFFSGHCASCGSLEASAHPRAPHGPKTQAAWRPDIDPFPPPRHGDAGSQPSLIGLAVRRTRAGNDMSRAYRGEGVTVGTRAYAALRLQAARRQLHRPRGWRWVKHVPRQDGDRGHRMYVAMDFGALIPSLVAGRIVPWPRASKSAPRAASRCYLRRAQVRPGARPSPWCAQATPQNLPQFPRYRRERRRRPRVPRRQHRGDPRQRDEKACPTRSSSGGRKGRRHLGPFLSGRPTAFALSAFAIADIVRPPRAT